MSFTRIFTTNFSEPNLSFRGTLTPMSSNNINTIVIHHTAGNANETAADIHRYYKKYL